MKKELLDVSDKTGHSRLLDSVVSFNPFVTYLRKRAGTEKTVKGYLLRQILSRFDENTAGTDEISLENIHAFDSLSELVYSCLAPVFAQESTFAWGLGAPFQPFIFYGTDSLYELLWNKAEKRVNPGFFSKTRETYHKENLQLAYRLILERLYNFDSPLPARQPRLYTDPATGISRYYQLHTDTRFVEVFAKNGLPDLNVKNLYSRMNNEGGYEVLEEALPLDLFRFSGISVISITDVTAKYALDNIKKSWILHTSENEKENYNTVIESLKMLVMDHNIEFELFPFFRVNNKLVYSYQKGGPSLLKSVWGEERLAPERFHAEAEGYSSNAINFFSKDIWQENEDEYGLLTLFKPFKIRSLALKPVFLNNKIVGVLGMYTGMDHMFDEKTLSLVEEAMPSLAQLLQVYIEEFNVEIENIIKEKFTSIQSSVQWKFNEVAWHFLYNKKKGMNSPEIEPIIFEQVYPLYGAVDIRNSTLERSKAVKADLRERLTLLYETFLEIKRNQKSSPLLEEMVFTCKKWLDIVLSEVMLQAHQETNLEYFLSHETVSFLEHFMQIDANHSPAVRRYLRITDQNNAHVSANQGDLELSMQMINDGINHYLEGEKNDIQATFPCYFEKFKTDGIEYDIYIGQSIEPAKQFNTFHIKNLRLWQLKSMVAMAKITHSLLSGMPKKLYTTQLIFAHNKTIDISFRNDERRFDVEGDYNIRYQMIKKRIDKVHIRNSNERLTQPGKIALVYLEERDIEDYLQHIYYLQETKLLENTLEEVDLEDLQGIQGLKAVRVGVCYK